MHDLHARWLDQLAEAELLLITRRRRKITAAEYAERKTAAEWRVREAFDAMAAAGVPEPTEPELLVELSAREQARSRAGWSRRPSHDRQRAWHRAVVEALDMRYPAWRYGRFHDGR